MIIPINTEKKYNIEIKKHLLSEAGLKLITYTKVAKLCIITDKNVHSIYTRTLINALSSTGFEIHKIVFDSGEKTKSFKSLEYILNYLSQENFSKSDMLIALGGGVIGDLTGFAASIYLRGINYIHFPTTLLAAVDSSVGGKTAINLPQGKNLVGSFWQPSAVLFDTKTIETLSKVELQNGISEMVKAALILDNSLFKLFEENSPSNLGYFIEDAIIKAIEVKKKIIEIDEKETGLRKMLNLGHTIGHSLEVCSNFNIPHGIAVAYGTLAISKIAEKKGWSKAHISSRLEEIYSKYQFDLSYHYSNVELAKAAYSDKKRTNELITLVIPEDIGKCTLKDMHISQLSDLFKIALDN